LVVDEKPVIEVLVAAKSIVTTPSTRVTEFTGNDQSLEEAKGDKTVSCEMGVPLALTTSMVGVDWVGEKG
jgi:hypothetical protein